MRLYFSPDTDLLHIAANIKYRSMESEFRTLWHLLAQNRISWFLISLCFKHFPLQHGVVVVVIV